MGFAPASMASATSCSSKPPSGPIKTPMLFPVRSTGSVLSSLAFPLQAHKESIERPVLLHRQRASLKVITECTSGTSIRLDCFAALSAICCQRDTFFPLSCYPVLPHIVWLKPEDYGVCPKFHCFLDDQFHLIRFRQALKKINAVFQLIIRLLDTEDVGSTSSSPAFSITQ